MAEVMMMGTPVNGLSSFVRQELTAKQLADVEAQLRPEEAAFFTGQLLATARVPLALVDRFTSLAAQAKGQTVEEFAHRAGRFGAELGFTTVYKIITALVSPQSMFRAAPSFWHRIYDGGTLVVDAKDTSATVRLRDFPASRATCGRITGWIEVIGSRAAKGTRVQHTACAAKGDPQCVWDFDWSSPPG
jgi:hypothetical protein